MKKYKDYFINVFIVLIVFLVIFFIKGIYPLGDYTLAFGDMQAQIVDFLYHYKSAFLGNGSLFIDFYTMSGINFWGQFAYYLASPFTLISLLVPINDLFKSISLITLGKFIAISITSLYFVKYYFKNLNSFGQLALSLAYTFCGYGLILYQITSFIDMLYIFPLLVIAVKKLLDGDSPKWYLLVCTYAIVTNFYISLITLVYIFLISYLYLRIFKKDIRGKSMVKLGLFTLLSFGVSAVILIPSFSQILSSERTILDLSYLLNSSFGPLADKIHYFLFSGVIIALSIRFVLSRKKYPKEVKFFLLLMLLLLLPVFVEPVNLLVHFGSYYSFPLRYNYIIILALVSASGFYLNNYDKMMVDYSYKVITLVGIIGITVFTLYHTILNYYSLQYAVYSLSINYVMTVFWVMLGALLFIILIFMFLPSLVLNRNHLGVYLFIFVSVTSFGYAYNYIGIDSSLEYNNNIQNSYRVLDDDVYKDGYKKVKITPEINVNGGNVVSNPFGFSFSSFTNADNRLGFKYLGYSIKMNVSSSVGGTYFTDALLGYKYLLTTKTIKDNNYTKLSSKGFNYYEFDYDVSYGYLFDIDKIPEVGSYSSFVNQNNIYRTWYNEDLFDIIELDTNVLYKEAYEIKLDIGESSSVYLEALYSYDVDSNLQLEGLFDVYVNGEKLFKKVPYEDNNGLINLGTYENEVVVLKIVPRYDLDLKYLNVGIMKDSKWKKFINEQKIDDYDISFDGNKIKINFESSEDNKVLFIPISYSDEYTMKINGNSSDIIKVFGNYIGISLNEGTNNIEITFVPKGLKLGVIVTIVSIVISILILKFRIYEVISNNNIISNIVKWIYIILYYLVILFIFLIPCICFVISFFVKI